MKILKVTNLHETSLANVVAIGAEKQPQLQVLRFVHIASDGLLASETRNYEQLWRNASTLAAVIKDRQGDGQGNIALMMNNHPEFVETMVASSILGVPFVPIDPRAKGLKLAYMLAHTDCEGLVCADYCLDQVLEVLGEDVKLKWILCVTSKEFALTSNVIGATKIEHYQQLLNNATSRLPAAANSPDSPMFMMFTSGTTGNPKAVVYSQGQYMAQADSLANLWRMSMMCFTRVYL